MDADATIKLHRCGVLGRVVGAFPCILPQAVYDEVVSRGKARLYQDAEAIEAIISGTVRVIENLGSQVLEEGLGAGENGIVDVLLQGFTGPDTVVVSDDKRFLTVLLMESVPFLTPAHVLVLLAKRGIMTGNEARDALERLRPLIRVAAYLEALEDLEQRGES